MAERKGFGAAAGREGGLKAVYVERGERETWSGVGGVLGGHFERIYRLFGGRAPLGHSQGWLVCHITNPRDPPFSPRPSTPSRARARERVLHREKNRGFYVFVRAARPIYSVDTTLDVISVWRCLPGDLRRPSEREMYLRNKLAGSRVSGFIRY